ncbi:MAG TPA: hypothetical protein VFH77_10305 [Streptomyces sp.]|nr:hypothetical protein [Streptomyces sp.]
MKYKKTATIVAGTLLALGTGTAAHAAGNPVHETNAPTNNVTPDTPAQQLSTDDVGTLLTATDDVMDVLHNGGLKREDGTLVKGDPKSTGMTIADIPLGVSSPD